jgi:hypothetical protein
VRKLKTEEALYLPPGDDAQPDAQDDEYDEDEPEANPRAAPFALAKPVRAAACSVQPVGLLDGDRVELERVLRIRASRRLGHARSLVPPPDCVALRVWALQLLSHT